MTVKTRAELKAENASDFPDNTARLISAADLRGQMDDTADSMLMDEDIAGLDVSQANVTATADGTKTLAAWTAAISSGAAGDFNYGTAGAITWPVTTRMKEVVYLLDFIPQSEHEAIRLGASTYDCSDAMDAILALPAAITEHPLYYEGGREIRFPIGTCYFSRTIELRKRFSLIGQGVGGRNGWSSRLMFAPNITGIHVATYHEATEDLEIVKGGDASCIFGLKIASLSGGVPNLALNTSGSGVGHGIGHGIWCSTRANIQQCIIQFFPQHGLYIRAAASVDTSTPEGYEAFGNANNMYVAHVCSLSNGGCGVYIDGPDTNAGNFIAIDVGQNMLSGIYESSLIGNTHIGHHADSNNYDALCSYAIGGVGVGTSKRHYCIDGPRANGQALPRLPSTAYALGNLAVNAGEMYICTVAGTTSAGTGPSGKSLGQVDGTVTWDWVWMGDYPNDVVARIPPDGHADSTKVWGYLHDSPTNPDHQPNYYPIWPNTEGGTIKTYRVGYPYWFDAGSASLQVLINPYVEGGDPSFISPSTIVIGLLKYVTEPGGQATYLHSGGWSSSRRYTANPGSLNAFNTWIHPVTDESIRWTAVGDYANGLAFLWENSTGNWMYQHARAGDAIPQRFTTLLNTLTGGRSVPIPAGNVMFPQGLWVGEFKEYARKLTATIAMPTTGEWAAGDLVLNSAPTAGEPFAWRCIATGTPGTWEPLYASTTPL